MRRLFDLTATAALLLAALLFDTATAHATSVQQFELSRLFAESALVVRAHVLEGSGYARDMASDGVCTELRLEILEVLAGQWDPAETLVFCLPGGVTPGGRMQMVLGAPMPRIGDTYVLFIRGGPWSYTPFVNWYYGALREESLQGQSVLVTGNGDCVLSANNAYIELGARLSSEDQVRHLNALGVSVDAIMSSQTSQGTLSGPVAGGGTQIRSERSNECAVSAEILNSLRQRANARASTASLSAAAQPAVLETFHTPLRAITQRGTQ